jgi:hypothetical protein
MARGQASSTAVIVDDIANPYLSSTGAGITGLLARRPRTALAGTRHDPVPPPRDEGVDLPGDVVVAEEIVTVHVIDPGLSAVRMPLVDIGIAATGLAMAAASDRARLVRVEGTVLLGGPTTWRGRRPGGTPTP